MYVRVNRVKASELGRLMALMSSEVEVDYYLDPDLYPPPSASRGMLRCSS